MTLDDYKLALAQANNDWAETRKQLKLALDRETTQRAAIKKIHESLDRVKAGFTSPSKIWIRGRIEGLTEALELLGENRTDIAEMIKSRMSEVA